MGHRHYQERIESASGARRRLVRLAVWTATCVVAMLLGVSSIADAQGRGQGQGQGPGAGAGQRRTLEGTLEVLYEDSAAGTRLVHMLDTGTERVPLNIGQQRRRLTSGSRVRARGTMQNGTLALDPDGGADGPGLQTLALASPFTFGPQSTLVILFNFQDLVTEPYTTATANSVTFTQANNFHLENSYGQTSLQGIVKGWYTIAASTGVCAFNDWAKKADDAAIAAGVVVSNYTRRIYGFPYTSACNWWGLGTIGGGTPLFPSRAWINGLFVHQAVAHELGHNFGAHHSRSWTCDSSACMVTEYGDDHDIMGAAVNGHLNAFHKERLGWLGYGSSPSIQTVTATREYTIESYAAANGGLPKALKMLWTSDAGGNTYIYAEARTQVGADTGLAPGVVIHLGMDGPNQGAEIYELDLQPSTPTTDFILDPGQSITFEDAFTITTVSSGAFGAVLAITDLSATSPTALTPAPATGPYGGTATFSATLTATGSPVAGQSVAFTLNGAPVGSATTDASGIATLAGVSLSGLPATTYPTAIEASFAGDATYTASSATTSLTVSPKLVDPIVTASDKVYDGATAATLASCPVTGVVGSDSVGCTGTATFATSDAGLGQTVTAIGLTLTGAAATNYTLTTTTATTTASITPRVVTPFATVAAKSYDGTTAATLINCTVSEAIPGDSVACTGTATFDSPGAGNHRPVTVTGLTLTGSAAGNYSLSATTTTTTALIAALAVTPAVSAANKVYDATTAATVTSCTVSGVIDGDVVACTGTATFDTASVGPGKTVTASDLTLTGAGAGNYVLSSTTATTTAAITAVAMMPVVTAADKPYDGTTAATLTSCTVTGAIGEDVACTGGAAFDSAGVGTGKTVTASGLTLTGAGAGNYVLSSTTATTTAAITALTITPVVTAADKAYDGTTAATLTSCAVTGAVIGDVVACSGTATFDSAAVGTSKTVTANGLTLTGGAAGNYILSSTTATTTAAIAALTVTPVVTAADKEYDGTTTATLTSCTVTGALAGDVVACTGTATFDSAYISRDITVTVSDLTLTGAAAGNYVLSSTTATTTASICRHDGYACGKKAARGRSHAGGVTALLADLALRHDSTSGRRATPDAAYDSAAGGRGHP